MEILARFGRKRAKISVKQAFYQTDPLTIIVISVGKATFFTSFFPSSPRPWPNVEQNVNVCARDCSVISQH